MTFNKLTSFHLLRMNFNSINLILLKKYYPKILNKSQTKDVWLFITLGNIPQHKRENMWSEKLIKWVAMKVMNIKQYEDNWSILTVVNPHPKFMISKIRFSFKFWFLIRFGQMILVFEKFWPTETFYTKNSLIKSMC